MSASPHGGGGSLALAPHCALKRLETPCLYDIREDEVYELDEEAFAFLAAGPAHLETGGDPQTAALVAFCRREGLLVESAAPAPTAVPAAAASAPTLRYLLVHITDRCNLSCRHCFLGRPRGRELPLPAILGLAEEFQALQGLRFIVSGGEPLRHRSFAALNERLPEYRFRSILLSNGTLIDRATARGLRFHEVQVSLDGTEESHDLLRGRGSFALALRGLRTLAEAGVPISVASVAHAGNSDDFPRLQQILAELPLRGWSIDVPSPTGKMAENLDLLPDVARAAPLLELAFGGGFYGSGGDWACGAHLAAVMADGSICKCGFYADEPAGLVREGLAAAWSQMPRTRLAALSCRCSHLAACRGGCRYRAASHGSALGPDPVMCHRRGVPVGGDRTGS